MTSCQALLYNSFQIKNNLNSTGQTWYTNFMKKSNFKKLREKLGYTHVSLAEAVGIGHASVHNYESGRRKIPLALAVKLVELAKQSGIEIDVKYFLSP
jgi:DNA-binding XRE family transcriptional regulator